MPTRFDILDAVNLKSEMKNFVQKNIAAEFSSLTVVQGRALNKRLYKLHNTYCCTSKLSSDIRCELEYWDELVRLIVSRMENVNENNRVVGGWCTNHTMVRYLRTGMPMIVYPTATTNFVKKFTLFFMMVSGVFQLVRVQIDGGFSFWSQVIYSFAALFSIVYFWSINNMDFMIPQVGSFVLTLLTIVGLLRTQEEPWTAL